MTNSTSKNTLLLMLRLTPESPRDIVTAPRTVNTALRAMPNLLLTSSILLHEK